MVNNLEINLFFSILVFESA